MPLIIPVRKSVFIPSTSKKYLDSISEEHKEKIYQLLLVSSNKGLKEANWRIGALGFQIYKGVLTNNNSKAYCRI
jgi:hypothetical protein